MAARYQIHPLEQNFRDWEEGRVIKNCETCGKEYRANSNGRYCSGKCYQKTVPSQYQKMRSKLDKIRELVTTEHETKEQFIARVKLALDT